MVLFQFVNNYFILFYIAFLKGNASILGLNEQCVDSSGAVAADCMSELSTQVTSVMLTRLAIGNVLEVGVPWLKTRLSICFKTCCGGGGEDVISIDSDAVNLKAAVNGGSSQPQSTLNTPLIGRAAGNGVSAVNSRTSATFAGLSLAATIGSVKAGKPKLVKKKQKPHQAEVESLKTKYGEGPVGGTLWDYNELLIQFGYVVLFAPAFPMASTVSFFSNITENSGDGAKLLLETQRPEYAGAESIGTWQSMFRLFAIIGVITNSLIIGFTSHELRDLTGNDFSALERLIIVVVMEHMILVIQFVMSVFVPDVPGWLRQIQVRTHAIRKIEDEFEQYKANQQAAGIDPNDLESDRAEAGDSSFEVAYEDMDSDDELTPDVTVPITLPPPKQQAPPLLKQWSMVTAPGAGIRTVNEAGGSGGSGGPDTAFGTSTGSGGSGGSGGAAASAASLLVQPTLTESVHSAQPQNLRAGGMRLSHAPSFHHHGGSRSLHSRDFKSMHRDSKF